MYKRQISNLLIGNQQDLGTIIYIDNGSDDKERDRIEDFVGNKIYMVENANNKGFSIAINQGIHRSNPDHNVLVLNNDCFLPPGCLSTLNEQLHSHPKNGAIGPITCDLGDSSLIRHQSVAGLDKAPTHGSIDNISSQEITKRFQNENKRVHYVQQLPFFCTLMKREAISQVGVLDNEKFPDGLAADDDWCYRATKLGWHCLLTFSAFAEHKHKYTFNTLGIDRKTLLSQATKKLTKG